MADEPTEAIRALLVEAMDGHAIYEATELNGVYDEDWPVWYASYAIEHGIGPLLGKPVRLEELADFLATSNVDFEQTDAKSAESWAAYTARRISEDL
jgi:hypothetical protein